MGVSTSVFGYWLVIAKYRGLMGMGIDHALLCVTCTRARKHNLRGSESKMNMIVRELICISGWHYAPLRKNG